MAKKVERN